MSAAILKTNLPQEAADYVDCKLTCCVKYDSRPVTVNAVAVTARGSR
jgi:hypothetical protein